MKGKILGLGIISGEDGNRYSFSLEDIQNLGSKDENALVNCEVDFEVENSNAKAIFITKSSFTANSVNSVIRNFGKEDISSIKIKTYLYVAGSLLGFIPILGQILFLVGIVCLYWAIISISRISGIPLVKNFILTFVCFLIGGVIIASSFFISGLIHNGSVGVVILGIGIVICVLGFVFNYLYYKGLSRATNEKFFFYAFIFRIIGVFTIWTIYVGLILLFIGQIFELIAWVKFKEIKKAEDFS